MNKDLEKFYTEGTESERLHFHPLERERTLAILSKRLPPAPAIVLDIGGATGVYSFILAECGYEVHLADPIASHIEQAKEIGKGKRTNLESFNVLDARRLDFPNEFADVVLLFGPLYHLFSSEDRKLALAEAARVLKPGGTLFAVGIPRFASLIDAMNKDTIYSKLDIIADDLETGVHRKRQSGIDFLYLHDPNEFEREIEAGGFCDTIVVAVEGPVWHDGVVAKLQEDRAKWDQLLHLLEKIESEPTVIGASAHIMAIARKP